MNAFGCKWGILGIILFRDCLLLNAVFDNDDEA